MKEEQTKEFAISNLLSMEPLPDSAESASRQLIRLLCLQGILPEPTKKAYQDYLKEAGKNTLCQSQKTDPQP